LRQSRRVPGPLRFRCLDVSVCFGQNH
jgi:hypothetical protein